MLRNAGTITLGSKVMVSDPCYTLETWCQGVLENVLPGEYNCSYNFDENKGRVSYMYVSHNSLDEKTVRNIVAYTEAEDFEVGVDSGMAGIYDYDYYAAHHKDDLDKEWYAKVYEATKIIQPNENYRKFMSEDWFFTIIDNYIEFVKTIIKPEDNINLYFPMLSDIDAIMGCSHTLEFADILKEKLKAANLSDGEIMSVSEDITADQKALVAMADVKFESMIKRARNKIPCSQLWPDYVSYSAATIDDKAFVSPSGFGDGGYVCNTHKNENRKIDFIEIFYYLEE